MNVSGLDMADAEKFKKIGLDEQLLYIEDEKARSIMIKNRENGTTYYTMGFGNIIPSHYEHCIEKFSNPSNAKRNATALYTKLVGRLIESRKFCAEAKVIIRTHKVNNPKQWGEEHL